ncbi:hypothetical protein BDZ45DRAFT_736650 [Acephala macrosclerotiorum]|nr:hypothetical protein BDZ45DRAFT_736650 [Acephala macrosclerotiorum]
MFDIDPRGGGSLLNGYCDRTAHEYRTMRFISDVTVLEPSPWEEAGIDSRAVAENDCILYLREDLGVLGHSRGTASLTTLAYRITPVTLNQPDVGYLGSLKLELEAQRPKFTPGTEGKPLLVLPSESPSWWPKIPIFLPLEDTTFPNSPKQAETEHHSDLLSPIKAAFFPKEVSEAVLPARPFNHLMVNGDLGETLFILELVNRTSSSLKARLFIGVAIYYKNKPSTNSSSSSKHLANKIDLTSDYSLCISTMSFQSQIVEVSAPDYVHSTMPHPLNPTTLPITVPQAQSRHSVAILDLRDEQEPNTKITTEHQQPMAQFNSVLLTTVPDVQGNPEVDLPKSSDQPIFAQPNNPPTSVQSKDTIEPGTELRINSQGETTTRSDQQVRGKPLVTFHPFPRLPTELRLKIWKFALPPPTTFSLNGYVEQSPSLPLFFEERQSTFVPTSKPTRAVAFLRASFESREVYMSEFPSVLPFRVWGNFQQYSMDWHDDRDPIPDLTFGQLRFGSQDAFFVNEDDMWGMILNRSFWRALKQQGWTKDVKTLSIDLISYLGLEIPKFIAILVHFTGLEMVVVFSNQASSANTAGMRKLRINWERIKQAILAKKIKGVGIPRIVFRIQETGMISKSLNRPVNEYGRSGTGVQMRGLTKWRRKKVEVGVDVLVVIAAPMVAVLIVVGVAVAELDDVVELLITNAALKTCSLNCVPLTRKKLKVWPWARLLLFPRATAFHWQF